ncbi:sensor histidine kinase [Mucilaginibacter endophyticus]|uniref:sensor histidine kinase n=1 Tax=Mucilaginibacter endophyticus TaxID=2675003 RepID=UPI000E0D978F|nr:sensor histidine kinase [Mucilaginibacter endophyticus]
MKLLFTLGIILFIQFSVSGQSSIPQKSAAKSASQQSVSHDSNRFNLLLDSADQFRSQNKLQKAFHLLRETENGFPSATVSQKIQLYTRLLNISATLKQYRVADKYADKLQSIPTGIDNEAADQYAIYQALIPYFLATKKADKAAGYITLHNGLSKAQNNTAGLAQNNLWLFKLDSLHGDHLAALAHYRLYAALKDSVFEQIKKGQIAQLDSQYHTKNKDKRLKDQEINIALLKKQEVLQRQHLNQVRLIQNITIACAAVLFMLSGVIYSRYRLKQSANTKLESQQLEINQKNETLEHLAEQKDVLLEEKEWLIKEIHHRVKNNLQIVISLLNTQSVYLNDEKAHAAIRESQHRMQSIAFIHQKLYQSESRALIEAHIYIAELIEYLSNSFDTGKRICFEKDLVDLELDVSRAVPIGLILNEAITNSIKYAFPNDADGCISVSLCCVQENSFRLCVSDNGIGLPEDFEIAKCRSLGMNLMRGLSKQIGSSLKLENNNGLSISIDFKDEKLLKPNLN